jgi:SAM-dependent methyltransferase
MTYERQDRGDTEAYAAYFAGMDASMQQKVALTTAFFPTRGRIADMGCGSGRGTYDLACLYRGLQLVGVDINPVMVAYAREHYQRANLSYQAGDIAEAVFPPASLDGVLNSSVLHHVTSFNGYRLDRALAALDVHVAQLREGGVLIVRDFVAPDGPPLALLDLRDDDGEPGQLATAALFELFAHGFRSSQNPDGPVPYARLEPPRPGWARFRVGLRAAAEFVLRKDYRADWATELLEEYTYLTQAGFVQAFRVRGLRVLCALPLWNPWIVQNRFEGQVELRDADGTPLDFPPTNFLIVAEKLPPGSGVALAEERRAAQAAPGFLKLSAYRRRADGALFELAERPGATIDLAPWFVRDGQLFVLAKKDFPRPIVNACADQPRPDGLVLAGYLTEPISVIVQEGEPAEEAIRRALRERAGVGQDAILGLSAPAIYYPSPGGLSEQVRAYLAELAPGADADLPIENYTPFASAGSIRALDAVQVLRACQVGGMFDARLEAAIYRLLRQIGRSPGPWIGASIELRPEEALARRQAADERGAPNEASTRSLLKRLSPAAAVLAPAPQAAFEPGAAGERAGFLGVYAGHFVERDRHGSVLGEATFEYVVPARLSRNTVVALPVAQTPGGPVVAIELRDLPAPQHFTGSSALAAAPAWRLPAGADTRRALREHMARALQRDFGLAAGAIWELGGAYFPSPGATPEVVFPFAVEVAAEALAGTSLSLVRLDDLLRSLDAVRDLHLLIAAARLGHALGM